MFDFNASPIDNILSNVLEPRKILKWKIKDILHIFGNIVQLAFSQHTRLYRHLLNSFKREVEIRKSVFRKLHVFETDECER